MNIICFVLGAIVGVVVTVLLTKPKCAGVLKMYKIEPDEPASLVAHTLKNHSLPVPKPVILAVVDFEVVD